jgi:hypothetical protein
VVIQLGVLGSSTIDRSQLVGVFRVTSSATFLTRELVLLLLLLVLLQEKTILALTVVHEACESKGFGLAPFKTFMAVKCVFCLCFNSVRCLPQFSPLMLPSVSLLQASFESAHRGVVVIVLVRTPLLPSSFES